ncbi:MAG: dimethylsulfoniopropionate demethylase [Gammaproteobacteria bacterium]|nr:dimethylsulfoniopropionate demethylase [Gammaproteobacteria bacterium]
MSEKILSISKRTRVTPFTRRVEAAGVKAYTVYNHMLLPTVFESVEADYWHLCEHVQVWDVAAERQVEINGPDAARLVQLMTPRDLSKQESLQGKYAPMCDAEGKILNDPIVIKLSDDRWWISLADSDIKLWAKGLAQGYVLDVKVFEPDVSPLAVQGPKAEELVARVFGDAVKSIRFFRGEMLAFEGVDMYVARSGWSKQGGFEIYLPQWDLGEALWDALFAAGEDLNVRAGCPNGLERIEAGLLSYGSDMTDEDNALECGLGVFLNLDADVESLSLPALRAMADKQTRVHAGMLFDEPVDFASVANNIGGFDVLDGDECVGEVRSQIWSPRYKKHLAMGIVQKTWHEGRATVEIAGQQGRIVALPFSAEDLQA